MTNESITSLDMYTSYYLRYRQNNTLMVQDEIIQLLEKIKTELIVYSTSHLLSLAYSRLFFASHKNLISLNYLFFDEINYFGNYKLKDFPIYDAIIIIKKVNSYLINKFPSDLSELCWNMLSGKVQCKIDFVDINEDIRYIEQRVVSIRRNLYKAVPQANVNPFSATNVRQNDIINSYNSNLQRDYEINSTITNQSQIQSNNFSTKNEEKKTQKIIAEAEKTAKKKADGIIAEAEKSAKQRAEQIINDAEKNALQRATAITSNAAKAADDLIAKANKRISEMALPEREEAFINEQQQWNDSFSTIRQNLVLVNEEMHNIEVMVSETNVKKTYTLLIELFNIIADTKDSTLLIARQTENSDLENAAHNMNVFIEMISEYLVDYGISTIISSEGDLFDGKYHKPNQISDTFDPKRARILRSLRFGFAWQEQVLQKEIVEITY